MSRGRPRKYPLELLEQAVEDLKTHEKRHGLISDTARKYGIPPVTFFNYLRQKGLVFVDE